MVGTLLNISGLNAQDSIACEYKWQGDSLIKLKKYSEAYPKFLIALKIFEKNENWGDWDSGFLGLEKTALGMRDMQRIDSLTTVFSVVPEAEMYFLAKCHYNTAYAYFRMGYNYESKTHYEQSLKYFKSLSDSTDIKKAKKYLPSVYNSLCVSYSRLGDHINAHKYLNQGIEYSLKTKGNPRLCSFQSLKGRFYYNQERFDKALDQYEKVLQECGESAVLHEFLTELYLKFENLPKTKFHLERFKELYELRYGDEPYYYYYILKSEYFRKLKLHDLAIKERQIALKLLTETEDLRTQSKELALFADYLYSLNRKKESLGYAQKALSHFFTDLDDLNLRDRPNIEKKELPDVWNIESLETKAKYFRDQYNDEKDIQDLEEAKFYYDALFHYFDKTKDAYNSTAGQYKLGTYTQKIYSESIQFFANLYQQENKIEHFEKALDLAQSSNAYVLKNSVSERKSLELAGIPYDTINKFLQLKSLSSDSGEEDLDAINHLNNFKDFENKLKEDYPAIKQLQKNHIITLDSIQQVLPPSTILVKYYYEKSKLTRFTITNNTVQLNVIDLPEDFDSLINDYQKLISDPKNWNEKEYAETSKTIYSLIIKDILENSKFSDKKHLIIAPDGPIKKIAFNSMVTKEYENLLTVQDYLVYDYEISYLYYCAQLIQEDISTKDSKGFIGFGIEYNDVFLDELVKEFQSRQSEELIVRDMTLSPLKYAKTEAINSATILDGESIINEDATIKNVLSNINDHNLLHFSTHAFVDSENYMNSFIALSKDQNQEYQFKYEDILNLNLDSDLVVLSACQTSSGTNISGEGLMSLSRAFVQSGCKAAMGAYWNAPDLSTMKLMELFYSNLKEGMTKSSALRQAQIEYLENEEYGTPRTRSPFFWSSWAIYGDNASIPQLKNSIFSLSNKWMFILISLVGLSLIYFFRASRKTNHTT